MLRRERLCDDDEEITRRGRESRYGDMVVLAASCGCSSECPYFSFSLVAHPLCSNHHHIVSISLSSHCIFSFTTTSLPCPLSLSLFSVCVPIYLSGWMARAHWHVFLCTHTHSVRIHNVLACLAPCCCCLFQPHARALNYYYYYYVTIIERAHITHQCTVVVVVVVLVLLLHNNIYI